MDRFKKQWNFFYEIEYKHIHHAQDVDGFRDYFDNYPLSPYEMFCAIDKLMIDNSKLRSKLHESKQRYHALNAKKSSTVSTNFDHWLSEILAADPYYMVNIVCSYYDSCGICPYCAICNYGCNKQFDTFLQSVYKDSKN